jgi:hypothetical protein
MNRKRIGILLPVILAMGAETAEASTGGGAGGALMEFAGLLLAFGCFLVSWKVLSFVRGGRLAAGWQWLTWATFLLAAGQALAFLAYLMLLPAAYDIVTLLRVIALVLLFLGMIKMRKALA